MAVRWKWWKTGLYVMANPFDFARWPILDDHRKREWLKINCIFIEEDGLLRGQNEQKQRHLSWAPTPPPKERLALLIIRFGARVCASWICAKKYKWGRKQCVLGGAASARWTDRQTNERLNDKRLESWATKIGWTPSQCSSRLGHSSLLFHSTHLSNPHSSIESNGRAWSIGLRTK